MTCEEIQGDAGGLASLARDAPERRAAFAHARVCARCAAALAEGEALMRVLDEALPVQTLQPGALTRAKTEILAELHSESSAEPGEVARPPRRRRVPFTSSAALMGTTAVSYLLVIGFGTKLSSGVRAQTSLVIAAAAVLAAGAALLLGTFIPIIPLISVLVSGLVGGSGGLDPAVGIRCLGFEAMLALVPLTVAAVFAWRQRLAQPSQSLIVAASGGALVGQAALHVLCHGQQSHTHLFVFHTGGVLVAVAIAVVVSRLLRLRPAASG